MRDILFYIWLILTDCLPGILGKPVSPTAIFIWAGSTCTQTWHPPQDAVFREIIGHQRPLNAIPSTLQSLTKSSPVFVSKQSNMLREHLFWTTGISERRCHCKNAAQNNSTYLSMLSCKTAKQIFTQRQHALGFWLDHRSINITGLLCVCMMQTSKVLSSDPLFLI